SVILDDDRDVAPGSELGDAPEPIGGAVHLLVVAAGRRGVHADGEATEELGCFDPLVMILDRCGPRRRVGVAESAFPVDHDQATLDADIGAAAFHLREVALVVRFILEELVDVFHGANAEVVLGHPSEIEMIHLAGKERFVKRPFGEGYLEPRTTGRRQALGTHTRREAEASGDAHGLIEESTAVHYQAHSFISPFVARTKCKSLMPTGPLPTTFRPTRLGSSFRSLAS